MERREFIFGSLGVAATTLAGCRTAAKASCGPVPKEGDIRSLYIGLGNNMWCDWYPDDFDTSAIKNGLPDKKLRCRDEIWLKATDYAAAKGVNQILNGTDAAQLIPQVAQRLERIQR